MKIKFRAFALVLLIVGTIVPHNAIAQTRLGLHVTQEELNIWKKRMVSGPYKKTGDVSNNSPGDWDRIVSKKVTFLSNPSGQRWAGQTVNNCAQVYNPDPGQGRGDLIVAAGFYYLLADTAGDRENVRTALRNELLAQAGTAGTDFSNRTRWCIPGPIIDDGTNIADWLTRLLFAYDYIRSTLSASDQKTLDTWFYNGGFFLAKIFDGWITSAKLPGRNKNDYSNPTDEGIGEAYFVKTHFGGFQTDGWSQSWSNRSAGQIRFAALAGILVNDSYLKDQGKRFCEEWIKYAVFPDGTMAEQFRGINDVGFPSHGFSYPMLLLGPCLTIADAFARTGDYELYNYSTSTGYHGTAGGPKSLLQIMNLILGYVNHATVRYATENPANSSNPNYIIDTVDGLSGEQIVDDTYVAQANVFYKSTFIKSIYMRTASGAPVYPTGGGATGGYPAWTGEWGVYPAMLFLFGQMENVVWPYPTAGSQLPSMNFAAVPNTIASGQSSALTWSTSNVTSCTGSGGWTGTIPTSGTQTVTPAQSTTYTLSCTGTAGAATQSTTVTVSAPPNSTAPNAPTTLTVSVSP